MCDGRAVLLALAVVGFAVLWSNDHPPTAQRTAALYDGFVTQIDASSSRSEDAVDEASFLVGDLACSEEEALPSQCREASIASKMAEDSLTDEPLEGLFVSDRVDGDVAGFVSEAIR